MASLKILETNIVHASDVIYWVDGSTASSEELMERLPRPVTVRLTERPSDLQLLHSNGKTAFWRRLNGLIVDGVADEAEKAFPPSVPYSLAGNVHDPKGLYNPRNFSVTAGTAAGHRIVLYPAPLGARFSKAGGLKGTLRWDGTDTVVPWAILTLQVTTPLGDPMVFRAQACDRGDFILPLKRLPPLPEGIDHYDAELSIAAPAADATAETMDPADLTAALLGRPDIADTFAASIALEIIFGDIRLLQTLNEKYLFVQSS
jgi:hypothetical protein